jgi:hypothetical protein
MQPGEKLALEIPLVPFDSERIMARSISTTVNNVRNQGPQCVVSRERKMS